MECQCVVFDMDGVLFDSEALVLNSWEIIAEKYHIPDIQSTCQKCLGTNAATSRQLFLDTYGAAFCYDSYKKEMSAQYWKSVEAGKLALKSGVREILEALRAHHVPVGLASSTRKAAIQQQLELFGLASYFDSIIGGDQVTHSKPHPEIYLTACAALDTAPELAYAVEDSYNGIRAAARAGMQAIMIPDLLPPTEEMHQLAAHIFQDMQTFQSNLFAKAQETPSVQK